MATVTHIWEMPSGVTRSTAFPGIVRANGTTIPVAGYAFDPGNEEAIFLPFRAAGYASGDLTVTCDWYADTATTGNVVWGAQAAAITPSADAQDVETDGLPTITVVVGAAGASSQRLMRTTITLTGAALDSLAADDDVKLRLARVAANGSDTMAGDAILTRVVVSYADSGGSGGIQATLLDAKGDLVVASAADTAGRLAVGTNRKVPVADSAATLGISWSEPVAGLYDIREFGAVGTGADDHTVFAAAIAGVPEGSTIWVPPGDYLLGSTLVIDRHVSLKGMWTRDKNDANSDQPYGTIISPTTTTAQATMTAGMIRVQRSWVEVDGLFLAGLGAANGGSGLRFSGTDPGAGGRHCHAARARVGVAEFQTGVVFGDWSDHCSLHGSACNGNRDGVAFEEDNHFDHYTEDTLLDGNARSSVHLPDAVGTDNFVMVRTHLGFSPYGIYQDDASSSGKGFSGLTMLGCPIEAITTRHMELGTAGLITVDGGYWGWADDPANSAVLIKALAFGPCRFNMRLDPTLGNPLSPAVIEIDGYNNDPIDIRTPLNDWAQAYFTGDYVGPAGAPYAASFTPEADYSTNQTVVCTGNVTAVNIPTGRTDLPVDVAFIASGATRTVTIASGIRTSTGSTRGPHSIASGQALACRFEYIAGAWTITRALITAT